MNDGRLPMHLSYSIHNSTRDLSAGLGSDGAGTKFALKGFFSCATGAAAAAAFGGWTICFVVAAVPSPVLFADDDAGGSGRMDLAAAGLEPRGLCRGATEVLPPVLGGSDCGCWGDITGVPVRGLSYQPSVSVFHWISFEKACSSNPSRVRTTIRLQGASCIIL